LPKEPAVHTPPIHFDLGGPVDIDLQVMNLVDESEKTPHEGDSLRYVIKTQPSNLG
jgi:hypothetical protein